MTDAHDWTVHYRTLLEASHWHIQEMRLEKDG
jgi:hypothetical protein